MSTPRTMLCRCEDVTAEDARDAIRDGYGCFEDLKRFLGVATGPCQGKACVQACMRLVAEERGIPLDEVDVMTFRPPVRPVPFAVLAALDDADEPSTGRTEPTETASVPSVSSVDRQAGQR
jgi:bacterioferritin-associated ferredoxin